VVLSWGYTMFYVYVVVSESTRRCYVGQTENIERRVAEHNTLDHKTAGG
jgi:predicted GIY-YIG superfamily endonuclease